MDTSQSIRNNILAECRRRIAEESVPRIEQCLNMLTEEEIWQHPNGNSNSIGNLVLHLSGNVRQWIMTGIDGQKDVRNRPEEFSTPGDIDKRTLVNYLHVMLRDMEEVLNRVTIDDLLRKTVVQGYNETGISVIIHVIEHFSYHTGQIVFYTKLLKDVDMKFYDL